MTQFEKMAQSPITCDICGGTMITLYGCGWDNDRIMCSNRDCSGEIIFPTSTEVTPEETNDNKLSTDEEEILESLLLTNGDIDYSDCINRARAVFHKQNGQFIDDRKFIIILINIINKLVLIYVKKIGL